ncbi:hypothetical protein BDQ12DRAFT_744063 [Crucibulum laeve]|uniref:Protein kinase domain-containing protein n=1 Tax=Crucibulum laeve TaxID=68775 RepID=A0A5C3M497_9AGAR|nr:hypothetical protein BDQ12DRAFT_744063 [Crucibulum laeve]
MFEGVSIPFLIWELQLEVGEGGSDASTQAELSMRRILTQENVSEFVKKCCCPILMLAGSGPWLTVLGGVFTDNLIVQRLTDMMWIGHSTTQDEPRVYRLARVLLSLRNNLHRLRDYYAEINNSKHIPTFDVSRPHPRNYPYPTSFLDSKSGKTLRFKYVQALENNAKCVTYKAEITDSQGTGAPKDIVVKFVSRYGKTVHEFLAQQNHAPCLRYFGLLDGQSSTKALDHPAPELPSHALPLCSMNMVVMDYVTTHDKPWPQDAREQISKVLDKLHAGGYVFGDLRSPNVLFDQSNEGKFIDFDWSGSDQCTYYPLNLSQSIKWADGAGDLLPILPEHDRQMLENLPFEE